MGSKMPGCIAACPAGSIAARPDQQCRQRYDGRDHDRAADAQRRLENHLSPVSVHAGEFRRQDRGRPRRRADHGRVETGAGAVRLARLVVLLPVLDLGHHRRLHRQSRPHPLGSAGDGGDMVAGAIPDGRHRQLHHAADLPRDPRRRRGPGVLGGGACDLQMVSRREADAADRHPVAGFGVRRDPRGAGAELDHRQSQLALCVRRARRGRPDVGGGVAGDGQGRAAGADGRDGGGGSARALFPASDLAHLHRLLRRHLRRLLGVVARPDLVHAVHRQGIWASRKRMPGGFRCCPGCSAPSSCC